MSKDLLAALGLLGAGAMLTGCATPSVKYVAIEENMTGEVADIYALNSATVTVTAPSPKAAAATDAAKAAKKEGASAAESTPTISVSVVADSQRRIGVDPTKNVWSSTMVNIEKVPNTERVASIGVETTDNAKAFVTTVGGLIVQALQVSALWSSKVPSQPEASCVLNSAPGSGITFDLKGVNIKTEADIQVRNQNSCISVKYGAAPIEAIPFSGLPKGTKTEHYYYSACRDVDITVKSEDGASVTERFRIPDSNWLQKVAFPYKGSITMHSICGVSVTTSAQANPMAPYEFATELLKQAELIRKASDGK